MNTKNDVLKKWFFIDSILLNEHAKKAIKSDDDYNEYISLKSALLSNLYEMYDHIGYKIKEASEDRRLLQIEGRDIAIQSKQVAANMLEDSKMKKSLRKSILEHTKKSKDTNIKAVSESIINTRFKKMCLDNMLMALPLIECSTNIDDDFKFQILENSYIAIRSELVKLSSKIIG